MKQASKQSHLRHETLLLGVPLLVHADVSRPFYEFIHPITPTAPHVRSSPHAFTAPHGILGVMTTVGSFFPVDPAVRLRSAVRPRARAMAQATYF